MTYHNRMTNPPDEPSQPTEQEELNQSRTLFANFRIVSLMTLFSRILGLSRDMGMAMLFGNSAIMDAFSIAFKVPNLARRLFGEGALTTAFLPAFISEREHQGLPQAWRLATAVFMSLTFFLGATTLLFELILATLYYCGNWGQETSLLIELTAIMLPYLLLICLVAQISAVMHAQGKFGWPAFAPLLLNVVWLFAMFVPAPFLQQKQAQVYLVSWFILLAGVIQLGLIIRPLYKLGYRFDPNWRQSKTRLKEVIRTMLPVMLGLSLSQLVAFSDSIIAWCFASAETGSRIMIDAWNLEYPLNSGTASALYFGQRLFQFPLGFFGIALGTVLFPLMAQHADKGEKHELQKTLMMGLQMVIGVGFPASVGLVLMAKPLTILLFQHGAFTPEHTSQTSVMIATYGAGVWASCALLILNRAFYAMNDQITPLKVGLNLVLLNLFLNLLLIWFIGGIGLPLSTTLCTSIQAYLVTRVFEEKVGPVDWRLLGGTVARCLLATSLMAVACYLTLTYSPQLPGLTGRLLNVFLPIAVAVLVYAAAAHLLRLNFLWKLVKRS